MSRPVHTQTHPPLPRYPPPDPWGGVDGDGLTEHVYVPNADSTPDASGASMRTARMRAPCLPRPLGQPEPNIGSEFASASACAPATPRSLAFGRHPAACELPSFVPDTTNLYGPCERSAMPATSFAHAKLNALSVPVLDMESDRLARACGQGPSFSTLNSLSQKEDPGPSWAALPRILGKTRQDEVPSTSNWSGGDAPWNLPEFAAPRPTWSVRPRARSVRVPTRGYSSNVPARPRSASQPASIPVFCPSTPRPVLRSLRAVLDRDGVRLAECLDVQRVLDRWARQQRRNTESGQGSSINEDKVTDKTFGSPVSVAVQCASMATVLGGYQHPIPWVVYACIEELNRTGIYQPGLFRAVPHRTRLEKLISGFDLPLRPPSSEQLCPPIVPTPSNTRASLRKESMADVCALFKSYLDALPEPLLEENLVLALYHLCVEPSSLRESRKVFATADRQSDESFVSHTRPRSQLRTHARICSAPVISQTSFVLTPSEKRHVAQSLETAQIVVAQHLLRLASPPLCASFAYLCAFFTQLPLSPDNGISLDDVSRMFGHALAGGALATRNAVLMWLLERWVRISDGLFEIGGDSENEDEGSGDPIPPSISPASGSVSDTTHRQVGVSSDALELAEIGEARRHSTVSSDGSDSVLTYASETDDSSVAVRTPFGEGAFGSLPAVRENELESEEQQVAAPRDHIDISGRAYPFMYEKLPSRGRTPFEGKAELGFGDLFAVHLHQKYPSGSESASSTSTDEQSPPPSDYDSSSEIHSRMSSGRVTSSDGTSRCSPAPSPRPESRNVI